MFMLWRGRAAPETLLPMSARRMRFLVVSENGEWFVYEVGTGQPMASFPTRETAAGTARHLAEMTGAELLLMNADGSLASRESCELRATA